MIKIEQSETYQRWEESLKDYKVRTIVAARINRFARGLPGDVKPVGEGVSELRIHYGAGYRVYFKQRGKHFVLLLCGGDKSSQRHDIEIAKQIAREWSEENG